MLVSIMKTDGRAGYREVVPRQSITIVASGEQMTGIPKSLTFIHQVQEKVPNLMVRNGLT